MTKTVSLKELRPELPKVMRAVDERMDRFFVTRRGHPFAVILSLDDYEGLLETIEILGDKKLMARLKKAEKEVREGKTRPLNEIRRSLGLE